MFGLLGGSQRDPAGSASEPNRRKLAILPGLTHYNIFSDPTPAAVAIPFLDDPTALAR